MPQVEIKFSADIALEVDRLFSAIETLINAKDPSAGDSKSRAFVVNHFHHIHVYISIKILRKPHRDNAFMQSLSNDLDKLIATFMPPSCYYAIELDFLSDFYTTKMSGPL